MKQYPSIGKYNCILPDIKFHTFKKMDGSNLRFEWSSKKGWYKYGTRNRLMDESDPLFGQAIPIFEETLADRVEEIFVYKKYQRAILFCEFWGLFSFAGNHEQGEHKRLTVIDLDVYKKGLVHPKELVETFDVLIGSNYLGLRYWDKEFIDWVKELEPKDDGGLQCEGFVGKTEVKNKRIMKKIKTDWWYKTVYKKFEGSKATEITRS